MLRALAVLFVFASHFMDALGNRLFGSLGRFGVILFFVHTSFVLMKSLERLEGEASNDARLAMAFWCRRFFRIYPLAILCVVFVAVFHIPGALGQAYEWIGTKEFLSNLALAQNLTYSRDILGPLWSLPLEVQMYVLLPLLYFVLRGGRYRSVGLWVLSVLLAMLMPRVSERLNVFRYAPCFVAGVLAYDLIRNKGWNVKLPAWVWPIGIGLAIALFGPHDNVSLPAKIGRAWLASLLVAILYANVKEMSDNALEPVWRWIAERSYGIYLCHIILIWLAVQVMSGAPVWLRAVVLISGSIAVPALLYVSIEKPLISAGGRLAKRLIAEPVRIEPSVNR